MQQYKIEQCHMIWYRYDVMQILHNSMISYYKMQYSEYNHVMYCKYDTIRHSKTQEYVKYDDV